MNRWFLFVFVSILMSLGHISGSFAQARRNVSPSTFLKSESAVVKLGVWDKFGGPKAYTATFVVTAPSGKQNRAQKDVGSDEGWVYVDFPNDFTGGAPDYSTNATYQWKCLVSGKEVANGQFQWGSSRASTSATAKVSDENDEMTSRRETLKRRDPAPAEIDPKVLNQPQESKPLIGYVGKEHVADGCGCTYFFKGDRTHPIYSDDFGANIWMNIDGRDVKLKRVSPVSVPKGEVKKGQRTISRYVAPGIEVRSDIVVGKDYGEGNDYSGTITITKGNRVQTTQVVGSCGC